MTGKRTGLNKLLYEAKSAYYKGDPIMSDEVYDRLEEQFKESLKHSMVEHMVDKLNVGASVQGARLPHMFPMYSLQKVYKGEKDPSTFLPGVVTVTPKLDGAAVSIQYIDGQLTMALTRGDGKKGLDITDKIRHLVPNEIYSKQAKQITGEIVAPKEIPNARNYAAGALNLKDIEEVKRRDLTFVSYGVQPSITPDWSDDMKMLQHMRFSTAIDSNWEQFPQDGDVWRINSHKEFDELGYTSHHPRGAFALKEKQEGIVTKLLDVKWQVGKSGAVSPVAILEPCIIGEATVSRATLHNMAIIESLDLEIGCMVEVIRAGEIIPQIVARVD